MVGWAGRGPVRSTHEKSRTFVQMGKRALADRQIVVGVSYSGQNSMDRGGGADRGDGTFLPNTPNIA
jgi:hypothetical protein